VLGMHRSGTSCVGNLLTRLGLYFGDESISTGAGRENPKGFFERRDVREVCDTILQGVGCDWWAVTDFSPDRVPAAVRAEAGEKFSRVLAELEEHRPWFIKEPRLCHVWPVLGGYASDPVFVHVWRHPIEVARSLAVRNGFPIDLGLSLWEAYVRAAHAVSRGAPSVTVSYNQLVESPARETERIVRQLKELGVDCKDAPDSEALREAIDPELHRNRRTSPEYDEFLGPSQQRLIDALASGRADDPELFRPLSAAVRLRLEDWVRREGVIFALRRQAADARGAKAEASKLLAGTVERDKRVTQLTSELVASEQRTLELEAENRQHLQHRQTIDGVAAVFDKHRQEWGAEREQLAAQLAGRSDEVARLSLLLARQEDTNRRASELIQDLEQSRQKLREEHRQIESEAASAQGEMQSLEQQLSTERERRERVERERDEFKRAQRASEARLTTAHDDLAQHARYLEQVKAHFSSLRAKVERQQQAEIIDAHKVLTDAAAQKAQAVALWRHTGMASVRSLFRGSQWHTPAEAKSVPRSLYLHYRWIRRRKDAADIALIAGSGLFDRDYYLQTNDDVAQSGIDPLLHFMDFGADEMRRPSLLFDMSYYLRNNPEVAKNEINPLLHYIRVGRAEGRLPLPPPVRSVAGNWVFPPAPVRKSPPKAEVGRHITAGSPGPKPERIVIYTAVAGGYDKLQPPGFALPGCDFVAFSDDELEVEGWQVRPFNYFHSDPTRMARFVKLHPHIYFPEYDHSIWIDANIGIQGDIRVFFDCLSAESSLATFVHPLRNCVYYEGAECIKRKKDSADVIKHHLDRYRAEGVPEEIGMWETNILARRHNEPACIALMTAWWREMEIGSRRDQISLPVAARRLSFDISPLGPKGVDARDHQLVTLVKHPAERTIAPDTRLPAAVRKKVDVDTISMDIGVCVYNAAGETRDCLESLVASRRPNDRIIVVDDGSDAETATLVSQFAKDHERFTLIRHERNLGYTVSANAALKATGGDWFVLLNSDTIVPSRALPKLIAAGEQFAQLGVVGPLSNAASWQTVPEMTGPDGKFMVNQIPPSMNIEDMDRLCEELSSGVVPIVPLVNGFCFAIRRALVERNGPFDEASFPQGYGEEDDFCLRAGAAGFLCGIATDAYVFHAKSASFTPQRRLPLVEAGQKALRLKHSADRLKAATDTLKKHAELQRVRERIAARVKLMQLEDVSSRDRQAKATLDA